MHIYHLYIFFYEVSVKVLLKKTGLFVFLLLSFQSSSYIFITVFFKVYFLQIFSSSMVYLLILLMLSFAEKMFLIFMKYSFIILPLVLHLKSLLYTQDHLGFLLCYLLGIFSFAFYI